VWSWQVNNIRLSESDRDELRDDAQSFLEDQQSSVQALTAALERAERRIIEKLEELKEEQNPL
jgi:Ribonuclease G/E